MEVINIKSKIFVFIFFAICIIPLLTMFVPTESSQDANEVLSEAPQLFYEDKTLNVNYISDLSDYFNDHFGLRNLMITAEHGIVGRIFGQSSEEKVILGDDGWLFYKETLDDFQATNVLPEREIYSVYKTVSLMDEYFKQNGMNFAFTVVPNKNSLYPDKMPWYYKGDDGAKNAQLLGDMLKNSDVNYIDLFEAFKNEDKTLYRKTDSHWTNEGAGFGADCILTALGKDFEPYYGSETKAITAETGDLFAMLYPSAKDSDTDVVFTRQPEFSYERPIRSVEDNFIRTLAENKENSLFMFRDSFGNTLYPYLAGEFSKSTFSRLIPYNLTLAKDEGADTAIIEIVERNIEWLISKGAIFPAPLRALPDVFEDVTQMTQIETAESEIQGFLKISGSIDESMVDDTDNIYILSGDNVFEATPGKGTQFTAYIPAESVTDSLLVGLSNK